MRRVASQSASAASASEGSPPGPPQASARTASAARATRALLVADGMAPALAVCRGYPETSRSATMGIGLVVRDWYFS